MSEATTPAGKQPPANTSAGHLHPLAALGSGAAMGTADSVPGVSGGTIALILGIYDRLIAGIADVLAVLRHPRSRPQRRQALAALTALLPLAGGAALALVVMLALLIGDKPTVHEDPQAFAEAMAEAPGILIRSGTAPYVFAAFFGLVLAGIPEPWWRRRGSRRLDWPLAALGAAISATLSLVPAAAVVPSAWALLLGGAVAITVMLLPGISGSLALLVLGLYQAVAGYVHERDPRLGWFLLGMLLGLLCFVPLLRALLARFHDRTMAFLTGLMAGSLVALWPWKAHYLPEAIPVHGPMQPLAPAENWPGVLALAVISLLLVHLLARWAGRRNSAP